MNPLSQQEYLTKKAELGRSLFTSGANCAQAVLCAFAEEIQAKEGLTQECLMKLALGFGGGMARMREVCGALSGMFMAADLLLPQGEKDKQYALLQEMAAEFKAETGSIICRELLGLTKMGPDSPISTPRTPQFYKKRPCTEMVALAITILAKRLFPDNEK